MNLLKIGEMVVNLDLVAEVIDRDYEHTEEPASAFGTPVTTRINKVTLVFAGGHRVTADGDRADALRRWLAEHHPPAEL